MIAVAVRRFTKVTQGDLVTPIGRMKDVIPHASPAALAILREVEFGSLHSAPTVPGHEVEDGSRPSAEVWPKDVVGGALSAKTGEETTPSIRAALQLGKAWMLAQPLLQ